MKFSMKNAALSELLGKAQGCISAAAVTENLKNYKFSALETGDLVVGSADIDIAFEGTCKGIQVEEPGTVCLPAAKMNDIVRLSTDVITIDASQKTFTADVASKKAKWKIQGRDPRDFPQMVLFAPDSPKFEVPKDILLSGLKSVRHAVTKEETRANMLMVFADASGFRATDGKRVALYLADGMDEMRIPAPAVDELVRLLAMSSAKKVQVRESKGSIAFLIGGDVFTSRQLTAKFVDLKSILTAAQNKSIHKVSVPKADFARCVEQVGITVSKKGLVELKMSPGSVVLNTVDESGNTGEAEMTATVEQSATVAVDITFVIEALKVMDSDKMTISYGIDSLTNPVIFSGKSAKCLILQMRN